MHILLHPQTHDSDILLYIDWLRFISFTVIGSRIYCTYVHVEMIMGEMISFPFFVNGFPRILSHTDVWYNVWWGWCYNSYIGNCIVHNTYNT